MDIQKTLNKLRIKEYNGLSTEKEYAELIEAYAAVACSSKVKTEAPLIFGLSENPAEASKQILPVYNTMLKGLIVASEKYMEKKNQTALKEFSCAFLAYDDIASLLADKMMDYGEGEAEEMLPEIEASPFLSAEEKDYEEPKKNIKKVFSTIQIINKYLEDAILKPDKPKLMILSALLFGTSHDLLMILRKIKEPAF